MEENKDRKLEEMRRRQLARRRYLQRKRKRRRIITIVLFIILIAVIAVAAFLWKKYSPTKETYDLNDYYGIEEDGQMAVIVDNHIAGGTGMIADGKAYIKYDTVRDSINSRFYWDSEGQQVLYTLPTATIAIPVESKEYSVAKDKQSEDYILVKLDNDTPYIALDFIQQYTNIDYEVYENPSRVMIVSDWGKTSVATVKRNTQVRYQAGVKSPILTEIEKGDEVTWLEDEGKWRKVRTKDGFMGYVRSRSLSKVKETTISRDFDEPEYTNISKDYTINMVWHNVTNTDANDNLETLLEKTSGLTTIAPTWYHVLNTNGDVYSIASDSYVTEAHKQGLEVWATLRDFDGDNGINSYDETYELLQNTKARTNIINTVINEAVEMGIDGINLDFEHISTDCGEHFIQFVRELSVRCRQNEIVLSVDNYVPKSFNLQYNRTEQGVVADYVVIMGYDEHYAGSEEAGSVASYDYVNDGITETLQEVPAEKIISAVPFFTRLWSEKSGTVESKALGMEDAADAVSAAGATATWDDTTKQNYATWKGSDGTKYEIWLEDEDSLKEKLQIMKDNNLAGTAAWALGQEDEKVWSVIKEYTTSSKE